MPLLKVFRRPGRAVYIGRGVTVTVGRQSTLDDVQLIIDAPEPIAVSRDDDGIGGHLKRQAALDEKFGAGEPGS